MKRFVLMHMGFERPTDEDMNAWREWFARIQDASIENIGFGKGIERTKAGDAPLPWDHSSITGLSIIRAENMEAACGLAEGNPFVSALRIYEVREP